MVMAEQAAPRPRLGSMMLPAPDVIDEPAAFLPPVAHPAPETSAGAQASSSLFGAERADSRALGQGGVAKWFLIGLYRGRTLPTRPATCATLWRQAWAPKVDRH